MFSSFLKERKEEICVFLEEYFKNKEKTFEKSIESKKALERLKQFTFRGGMIRGCSALMATQLWDLPCKKQEALKVAAACELFQSAGLIHDDIFDKDLLRRGQSTLFAQYIADVSHADSYHWGESMGINVGDISFMLTFDLLRSMNPEYASRCIEVATTEISTCIFGQMQDLSLSLNRETSEEEIFSLYRDKTARYTFSLPLQLGAIVSGASYEKVKLLAEFGEFVGILFQIKDDELNLLGDEKVTGKPVGSDIRENKKTIFRHYLLAKTSGKERERLQKMFGSQVSEKEIKEIRKALENCGALAEVRKVQERYLDHARTLLKTLSIAPSMQNLVEGWLVYNLERSK